MDHCRVLVAFVFSIGEHERQKLVLAELVERPPEGLDSVQTIRDIRGAIGIFDPCRCENLHAGERRGHEPKPAILLALRIVELDVVVIQKEKVFAFHVEDQRFCV